MATRDNRPVRASGWYPHATTLVPPTSNSIYSPSAAHPSAATAFTSNRADQPGSVLGGRCEHDFPLPGSPSVLADSVYAGSISETSEYDFWATTTATVSPVSSAATSPRGDPFDAEPWVAAAEGCARTHELAHDRTTSSAGDARAARRSPMREPTVAPSSVSFIHVTASDFSGDSVSAAPLRRLSDAQPPTPTRKRVRARPTVEERIAAGRIPRPPNSFILYRSAQYRRLSETNASEGDKLAQSDLSRLIAQMWREESPSVKEAYVRQAAEEKERHAQRFPNYIYRPVMPPRRKPAKKKEPTSCAPIQQPDAITASTSAGADPTRFSAGPSLVGTASSFEDRSISLPQLPLASPRKWRLFRSGATSDPDPSLSCPPFQPAAVQRPRVLQASPELPSPLAQYTEDDWPVPPMTASLEPSHEAAHEPELFMSFEDVLASSPKSRSGDLLVESFKIDPLPDYERGVENALQLSGLRDFAGPS